MKNNKKKTLEDEFAFLLDDSERDDMMRENMRIVLAFEKQCPSGSMSYAEREKAFKKFCEEWDEEHKKH